MICKDMKYTALYWALRFFEVEEDVHVKSYNGYDVTIYADKQYVDFGEKIKNGRRYYLNSHKSFVVLECVDRLLTNGYLPEQIIISNFFDICLNTEKDHIGISCSAWDDYDGGDFITLQGLLADLLNIKAFAVLMCLNSRSVWVQIVMMYI